MRRRLVILATIAAAGVALVASAETAPVASPAAAVLVVDVGGRIVAANADGSGVRALTHPSALNYQSDANPTPSPDGSLIVFGRSAEVERVMVVHADGSGLRPLAVATLLDAQWSPDGSRVALETMPNFKLPSTGGVHVVDLSSGISIVAPDGSGAETLVDGAEHDRIGFSWSPDGRAIAYTAKDAIDVVDVATGATRVVAKMAGAWRPAWSPDGTHIAFVTDFDLYVASAAGGAPRRLAQHVAAETPVWSPDGTQLAYTSSTGSQPTRVVVLDVARGRVAFRIPSPAGSATAAPVWSADGSKLAFLRTRARGEFADVDGDVWVANADGSRAVQVTTAFPFGGSHSRPRWLPGATAVTPDPPPDVAVMRPVAPTALAGAYRIAAVDGDVAAVVPASDAGGGAIGIYRGGRGIVWVKGHADRAALRGNRIYWSWSGSDRTESATELWTSTWPGGRPVRLVGRSGGPGGDALLVSGDRSLVVYGDGGALWRLDGTRAVQIRKERTKLLEPLAVDGGRALLWNTHVLEVVNRQGKLLASFAAGSDPVTAGLSGSRIYLLDRSRILLRRLPKGRLAGTWTVGAPGLAGTGGIPHGTLVPYGTQNGYGDANYRLLDVATGRDKILALPEGMSPTSVGVGRTGLFYTATPPYRGVKGQIGFVPRARLTAALAGT